MPDTTLIAEPGAKDNSLRIAHPTPVQNDGQPVNTTRIQNTVATATEFVVVSWVQPSSSDGRRGWYDYEAYSTEQDARKAHEDYERGEYERHRAVCIFASRHGVPIGRIA